MYVIAMFALLGWVTIVSADFFSTQSQKEDETISQSIAENMLIYKQSAISYYIANPSASGVIQDSSLSTYLPTGYKKNYNWVANINAGYIYVYTTDIAATTKPLITEILAQNSSDSMFAGKNQNGILFSSTRGNTGISLPTFVPNGSPVLMGQ